MAQKDAKTVDPTPLVVLEKEIEAFKKELEDKLKGFNKIEFKPKNLDREKYRESADGAVKELNQLKDKCDDFIKRVNELKKENEATTLKDKDFDKRKKNEIKKVEDYIKKIVKALDKFKQDAAKLEKLEKEESKKASKADPKANSNKTASALASVFQPKKEALDAKSDEKKNEENAAVKQPEAENKDEDDDDEEEDEEDDDDEGVEDVEDVEENSGAKGLKTLAREQMTKSPKDEKGSKSLKDLIANSIIKNKTPTEKQDLNGSLIKNHDKSASEDESDEHSQTDLKASSTMRSENADTDNDKVLKSYENQLMDTAEEPEPPKAILKKKDSSSKLPKSVEISNKKDDKLKAESKTKIDTPKNIVKKDEEASDEQDTDDDVDDSEEESIDESSKKEKVKTLPVDEDEDDESIHDIGTKFVAVEDFSGEQDGDLAFKMKEILTLVKISDKNWYLVRNEKGKEGLAPRNFLEVMKSDDKKKLLLSQRSTDSTKSGLELWGLVKESIANKTLIDPEALKAIGAVPGSFSTSALEKLSHDLEYSYMQYLTPKLTESNLMFKNFFWELKANKLRNKLVTFQRIITINKCTHIPIPKKEELNVLGRFVRICLFDGKKVLSNIHMIKAYVENDETTWLFNNSVDEFSKISECSEMFVRCQAPTQPSTLGILFELSIHCVKKATNEESHISCGWVHLPFIDEARNMVQNKGYDLVLNGGNIFDEKGKPLNEDLARLRPNPSLFDTLIDKLFRESKIKFDVNTPNDRLNDRLNSLPEPLISSTILAPFIKYYLEELGLHILKPLVETGLTQIDANPLHSPFLASFTKSLEFPDILDAVKLAFDKRKGLMTRDQRNDESFRKKTFVELFTKIGYPLLHHATMPEIKLHNEEIMEARDTIIERHWQCVVKNSVLKSLLSENEEFEPFDVSEVSYEIVNEYTY